MQWILSDDVKSAQLASFHRFEHLREVPPLLRRNLSAPVLFEFLTERGVLDVLKTRQAIRQRTHVAAALHIVLPPKRIQPTAVFADVSGQ